MSIADNMLSVGCAAHVAAIHGESVTILDGSLAGKVFTAVRETDGDQIVNIGDVSDRRGKRWFRFIGQIPTLTRGTVVKTADGKRWSLMVAPQDGYLSTDYEAQEITTKDQI